MRSIPSGLTGTERPDRDQLDREPEVGRGRIGAYGIKGPHDEDVAPAREVAVGLRRVAWGEARGAFALAQLTLEAGCDANRLEAERGRVLGLADRLACDLRVGRRSDLELGNRGSGID